MTVESDFCSYSRGQDSLGWIGRPEQSSRKDEKNMEEIQVLRWMDV